jgi:hypothetical protein
MLNLLVCLSCVLFIGPIDKPDHDLPESVQQLIDQNAEAARRITSSPYFLEVRETMLHKDDEVSVILWSIWRAPGESRSSNSRIVYARNEAGLADQAKVLESYYGTKHRDLVTKLTRGTYRSSARIQGGMIPDADCDDPCNFLDIGSIGFEDISGKLHSNLEKLGVLKRDWETYESSITRAEFLTSASEVRYKGRDQMDGYWCAIVEVKYRRDQDLYETYWFDEGRNGLVLYTETWSEGKLIGRVKCTRAQEAFPGVFIPAEISQFKIVNADDPATEVAKLQYKRELVTLSFSPEEWPHATEKDFGFKFRPNSLVNDSRTQPRHLKVIGKDLDDVLFTCYRTGEFDRWCAERTGKPITSSVPINSTSLFREDLVDDSTPSGYGTVVIVAMVAMVAIAAAALLYFRRVKGVTNEQS